jgi:hypothetical protein
MVSAHVSHPHAGFPKSPPAQRSEVHRAPDRTGQGTVLLEPTQEKWGKIPDGVKTPHANAQRREREENKALMTSTEGEGRKKDVSKRRWK